MYKRILVPLDGSPLAEQVLPYVRILAKDLQSRVELIRVFSAVAESMADPIHGRYIDQMASAYHNQAMESLIGYATALRDAGVEVSSSAHEGDAAYHIVDHAANEGDTLIAMSTHGRSGIGRWVLGSVTDRVLRAAENPLLIIRARPQQTYSPSSVPTRSERWPTVVGVDTVLAALDGSPLAEQVLPHVVALAQGLELNLKVVRVAESAPGETESREYLHRVAEKLRGEGISSVEEQVLQGDPATALVDLTQQTPNGLVAMTTHGRSGVGRWVLGSVTDRVVRYSGTPVLVTRAA